MYPLIEWSKINAFSEVLGVTIIPALHRVGAMTVAITPILSSSEISHAVELVHSLL